MKMNCYTRLSVQSMMNELRTENYPDLSCFIGVDVENGGSTCITGETINGNIAFRVQEKKNYIGIYVDDINDPCADVKTESVIDGLFKFKYADTNAVFDAIKAAQTYLRPEKVVSNSLISMINILVDNAFCNVDETKHIGQNYGYTDGFRLKIMGTRTVDGLVYGVKDNKMVITALARPNVEEKDLIEELNENLLIATNVYSFVDSVQIIQN